MNTPQSPVEIMEKPLNSTNEPHKHKMEIVTTQKVRLYDGQGLPISLHDIFTFKACKCGLKQPVKVERV